MRDLTGMRFGRLIVIDRAPNKKKATIWNCLCDCGRKCTSYSTHMIRGNTQSCGCIREKSGNQHKDWTGYGEISGGRWKEINRSKWNRPSRENIEFTITIEYIWELFLKQNRRCILSGQEITMRDESRPQNRGTASLDRIDSKKGYIPGNVQWVHKDINRMKNIFEQAHFINMCKLIAENNYE